MNRIEGFITAHIGDSINECDDNFAYNLDSCNFAVADGSSSDFFSKIYAKLLADKFVENPLEFYNADNISDINSIWRSLVKDKLDAAGCRPGSFPYVRFQKMDPGCSTLIGLSFFEDEGVIKYHCSGLGDSVLFFKPKNHTVPTLQFSSYSKEDYSLDQSVEFGYTPIISRSYSTQWLENIKDFTGLMSEGVFYLMTDGMAEWILREDNGTIEDKFLELDNIHSQDDFIRYVDRIRANGAHNDDMTLLKIYIDDVVLNFDSKSSVIYDYRKEQSIIEDKENELRQKKIQEDLLKKQEEEELKVHEQKSKSTPVNNSLSWITGVIDNQKKINEERAEMEKQHQKNSLDAKNTAIIQAAQAKINNDNHAGDTSNNVPSPIIQQDSSSCVHDVDSSSTIEKKSESKAIEDLSVEEIKPSENIVSNDVRGLEPEDSLTSAEHLNSNSGEEPSNVQLNQGTNNIDSSAGESEKKKFLLLNIDYKYIVIAILMLLNVFLLLPKKTKSQTSCVKCQKIITAHSSDSITIDSLFDVTISQQNEIQELCKKISLYEKREEYLRNYPTAYRNVMLIKN